MTFCTQCYTKDYTKTKAKQGTVQNKHDNAEQRSYS